MLDSILWRLSLSGFLQEPPGPTTTLASEHVLTIVRLLCKQLNHGLALKVCLHFLCQHASWPTHAIFMAQCCHDCVARDPMFGRLRDRPHDNDNVTFVIPIGPSGRRPGCSGEGLEQLVMRPGPIDARLELHNTQPRSRQSMRCWRFQFL